MWHVRYIQTPVFKQCLQRVSATTNSSYKMKFVLVTVLSAMVCACAAQEGEKTVTKRGLAGLGYGYVPALSYGPVHSYSNQHSLSYAAPVAYSKVIVAAPAVSTVSYHGNYGNGLGYGVHGLGYSGYGLGYSGHGLGYGGYGGYGHGGYGHYY